mmetsp:Transcript_24565/g.57233  ORF Transcript_24565/g.57233 Transcript_24565/m.57233 type:complete len:92 (+) Transcript_24565:138-413(+)
MLADHDFLVSKNTFTVADVAVASYLLYVVQFFPGIQLQYPNVIRYMIRCASRPAYGRAFGPKVQSFVLQALEGMLSSSSKKAESPKLFGMF